MKVPLVFVFLFGSHPAKIRPCSCGPTCCPPASTHSCPSAPRRGERSPPRRGTLSTRPAHVVSIPPRTPAWHVASASAPQTQTQARRPRPIGTRPDGEANPPPLPPLTQSSKRSAQSLKAIYRWGCTQAILAIVISTADDLAKLERGQHFWRWSTFCPDRLSPSVVRMRGGDGTVPPLWMHGMAVVSRQTLRDRRTAEAP